MSIEYTVPSIILGLPFIFSLIDLMFIFVLTYKGVAQAQIAFSVKHSVCCTSFEIWVQSYIKNMFYQNLFSKNMSFYQNLFL